MLSHEMWATAAVLLDSQGTRRGAHRASITSGESNP